MGLENNQASRGGDKKLKDHEERARSGYGGRNSDKETKENWVPSQRGKTNQGLSRRTRKNRKLGGDTERNGVSVTGWLSCVRRMRSHTGLQKQ